MYNEIEKKEVSKRLWVVPENDLEAKTIVELLKENGENVIITGQTWGASWENLEVDIKAQIEEAKVEGKNIYGVELQGDSKGCVNIDHHIYGDDDRSSDKASIEQVADILGVELTIEQIFIAENDKGYIPAMEKLGVKLDIEEEDLQEIISNVRMKDRECQGVTLEQEVQAKQAVDSLGKISEKQHYISVRLPHSKTSTVTDRLYGKYDNLLVISGDGETNFFGETEIIDMLNDKFKVVDEKGNSNCWCGGQLEQGNGFWGGYANQKAIEEAIEEMIAKKDEVEAGDTTFDCEK